MTTEKTVTTSRSHVKPAIILSAKDYNRLSTLAHAARNRLPDLASELAEEIGRAHVLSRNEIADHFVGMNDDVEFRDDTAGRVRQVTLVYPDEADISQGKISVMTPVGTALIGLRTGHSITWKTPLGETRQLTVVSVRKLHWR
ncbi:nucleoside diphosphate kinase regulator [Bradyrhizobium sp. 157]|uniref:nucleoside diphosphate kinase regulator n=1 Tax=Bradyrhizobium sp. 157 TaxID=2782631 RepID=UPI001FF6FF39|nr:nucleoside diphosphate kinase regulator [Bradyrhizobium sp. 157]MCK1638924.1 nucleoside diphosphate kinase regulator [Bradyrhizobium sp. 157]